jgi:hypothetical protein
MQIQSFVATMVRKLMQNIQNWTACVRRKMRLGEEQTHGELNVEFGSRLSMSAKFIARKISRDKTEAIRVVDEQRRSSATDVNQQGNLSHSITGKSPRGGREKMS